MSATEKHKDFQVKLVELIDRFHEENPDLYIADIRIHTGTRADMRLICTGVSVRIETQPN